MTQNPYTESSARYPFVVDRGKGQDQENRGVNRIPNWTWCDAIAPVHGRKYSNGGPFTALIRPLHSMVPRLVNRPAVFHQCRVGHRRSGVGHWHSILCRSTEPHETNCCRLRNACAVALVAAASTQHPRQNDAVRLTLGEMISGDKEADNSRRSAAALRRSHNTTAWRRWLYQCSDLTLHARHARHRFHFLLTCCRSCVGCIPATHLGCLGLSGRPRLRFIFRRNDAGWGFVTDTNGRLSDRHSGAEFRRTLLDGAWTLEKTQAARFA